MNFVLLVSIIIGLAVAGVVGTAQGKILDNMKIFVEDWNCSNIPSNGWVQNCNNVKSISSGMFLIVPAVASISSWAITVQKLGSVFD